MLAYKNCGRLKSNGIDTFVPWPFQFQQEKKTNSGYKHFHFILDVSYVAFLSCLFWAFKVKPLLDVLNLVLVSFMAVSILGLFFKTLAGLSLFFLTKIVLVVLKDLK